MTFSFFFRRCSSSLSHGSILPKKSLISRKPIRDVHPKTAVRTRFAPSPTGMLHIGSLRTALYNYLLARNTGGQFLLRLEDTDQNRLVLGAEKNIYQSLKWCGIKYDEGPIIGGPHGPYRQSERTEIYRAHIDTLLDSGHAYRCFCSKERLEKLRDSAKKLQPPTTVSYDRHCANLDDQEIKRKLEQGMPYTVRLKSPDQYPTFHDLLHGSLNIQPQVNKNDVRYDDPILVKSDNLPTYHFANVIDDHLMEITHVIRGEEWLPSTQKHIAIYNAFGWSPPKFVHIPLLTSSEDKKLSKRKGDSSVINLRDKGVLPEALVNFCVLFGWSPPRNMASTSHECFSLSEFERLFNLNYLTKGNAKVDDKKLWFFNKHYLQLQLEEPASLRHLVKQVLPRAQEHFGPAATNEKVTTILQTCGKALTTVHEFNDLFYYFFRKPDFNHSTLAQNFLRSHESSEVLAILETFRGKIGASNVDSVIQGTKDTLQISKRPIFESLRFALAGSQPGAKIPILINILGIGEANNRIAEAIAYLNKH
ncbi:MSE1 (YOL033W) [Zygosaccharomyces parabailii]|uniref:Glutamate--tRNA ligase, mitochondrial n=1 Tax=Zygosaccharomyces bailii (strain CLIB 213 / ATCC 58445 / CBS 680 / BCRC 21525 / NBRC 1098 / NCYC 1416 / NRRL Y-2227) TaxID=1333698 RepID=A0A8J2T9Q7_ZYGB2|nr:MSE1 (YOL033W) [Zygosaccharomyces parabailii]CDF90558.1 ZYBA0S07-03796g1_1 [Zygosaccharomyces bailii CLIB 213]CDH15075.1 related to Glutamate--tRNA ligase, mitochondrial [Zygosaccharomyces bailii ISA1307]